MSELVVLHDSDLPEDVVHLGRIMLRAQGLLRAAGDDVDARILGRHRTRMLAAEARGTPGSADAQG